MLFFLKVLLKRPVWWILYLTLKLNVWFIVMSESRECNRECSGMFQSEFVGEIPLCNVLFLNVVSNPISPPLSFSDKMSVKMILRFKRQETFSELQGFSVWIHVKSNQPNIVLSISYFTTIFKADLGGILFNNTQRSDIKFSEYSNCYLLQSGFDLVSISLLESEISLLYTYMEKSSLDF